MTTLIRLKRAKGKDVFLNAALISEVYTDPQYSVTIVVMSNGDGVFVEESPDGVYEAIYREEHPKEYSHCSYNRPL